MIYSCANKKMFYVLSVLLAALLPSVMAEMLPVDYTPSLLCSGVVEYDFYLPNGVTADDLNTQAIAMMSSSWSLLGADCKSDMKRLACARVYKPSVDANNFKKPCRSLCDATTYTGSTCAGMMEAFGTAVNCSTDEFDYSNDPNVCNTMEFTEGVLLVAEFIEPYVGPTCQGILDDILVPTLDTDPTTAPYLPPYVGQYITEFGVSGWVGLMPVMVESTCLTKFRRMACGLIFPSPSPTDVFAAIFGTIYMPAFPHKSVCTEFLYTCSELLDVIPEFGMDCNAVAGTIQLFPSDTQVIAEIDNGPGQNSTLLLSEPDYMENISFQAETLCPFAMVVPDDPTGDVSWIAGFGCAMACPFRGAFTAAEIDSLYILVTLCQWVTMLILLLSMYNIFFLTSPGKINPFYTLTCCIMFVSSVLYVLNLTGRQDFELTCKDNAQYRVIEDVGNSWNDFTCVALAIGSMLYDNFVYGVFIAMTSELYCRVILEKKDVSFLRYFYVGGVAVMMIFLALFQLLYPETGDVTIKGSFQFHCSWKSNQSQEQFFLMTFPFMIIYTCCTIGAIKVVYQLVTVSSKVSGSFANIWKSYRSMLISVFLFVGVLWVILFVTAPYYDFSKSDDFTDSAVTWVTCLVVEFLSDQENYLDVCGRTPDLRYPTEMVVMLFVIYFFLCPLGVLWISFNSESSKIWSKRFAPYKERFHFVLYPFLLAGKVFHRMLPNVEGISGRSKVHPSEPTPFPIRAVDKSPTEEANDPEESSNSPPISAAESPTSQQSTAGSSAITGNGKKYEVAEHMEVVSLV